MWRAPPTGGARLADAAHARFPGCLRIDMQPMSDSDASLWLAGQTHARQNRWEQAMACFGALVKSAPGFVPAWLELSNACQRLERYREALDAARKAAQISEDCHPMLALAVAARLRQFDENEAVVDYVRRTRLAERVPAQKRASLAMLLSNAGANELASRVVEETAGATTPAFFHMRGLLSMFAGDMPGAKGAFEQALRCDDAYAPAYELLSELPGSAGNADRIRAIGSLVQRSSVAPLHRVLLGYALHRELHALQEFDHAWAALSDAHRLSRELRPYDAARERQLFEALRLSRLPPRVASARERPGCTPIFIVGMYRSGSTLLERMLSGHPQVAAAGETYFVTRALAAATDHACRSVVDLPMASRLSGHNDLSWRSDLLARLEGASAGKLFVTEKQNANFLLLGQIACVLPHARFLHIVRDPADTCFSNLRTCFTREAAYARDMLDVAGYHGLYQGLMRHWRSLFADRILDVRYEELVADPAPVLSRAAAFCGFEYAATMADVSRPGGNITTASAGIARAGVDHGRGGSWRHYARQLSPMLDRLAQADGECREERQARSPLLEGSRVA